MAAGEDLAHRPQSGPGTCAGPSWRLGGPPDVHDQIRPAAGVAGMDCLGGGASETGEGAPTPRPSATKTAQVAVDAIAVQATTPLSVERPETGSMR